MAKTAAQMITIVADALGKSESAASISGATLSTRCIDFLNWGQQRMARFYSFHELNTYTESAATVTSVSRYPLVTGTNNLGLTRPKDIQSIRLIDSQNSRILVRKSPRWFDQKLPLITNYADGRPHIYIRWGNDVELFRRPDAAYTLYIRYPQWATDLTSGSTATDFERKDEVLIAAAILEGYLHLEEYESAKIWSARFIGLLTDAVRGEGDVDWEPQAQAMAGAYGQGGYTSGEPWIDPYAGVGDPLYSYPE
jgi:hypothetical protein